MKTVGKMTRLWFGVIATAVLAITVAAVGPAQAARGGTVVSHGILEELNGSGVAGQVTILDKGGHLRVNLDVNGLESPQSHLQHIHGFGDGSQASCPDMSLAGPDGVLSFADGLPAYGPPVITLGNDPVTDGSLAYSRTFTTTMAGEPVGTLGDLDQYVVVVHGLTIGGSYEPTLPVACAILTVNGNR